MLACGTDAHPNDSDPPEVAMKPIFACTVLVLLCLATGAARADADCVAVPGIAGEVETFLSHSASAQAAGQGTLPIREVLFGVTDIDDEDAAELDAREAVQLTRRSADGGDYGNRGPQKITVDGMFAGRETLFRLPKRILGHYRLDATGATLTYDPDHAVDVGERIIGIPIFLSVHRMIVTREKLSFFFGGNDGDEPDRCYLVQ
jgi:hypothetical protein